MWDWINKQGVRSSDDVIVQSEDRYGYSYVGRGLRFRIDVEPLRNSNGGYYEEIEESSFDHLPEDQAEIVKQDVEHALTFMKIEHRFV